MNCLLERTCNVLNEKSKKVIRKAFRLLQVKIPASVLLIPMRGVNLLNIQKVCLTQFSSGLQVKLKVVTLLLIRAQFFHLTRCLLTSKL